MMVESKQRTPRNIYNTVGGLKFNEGLNLFEIILKNDLFCNTFYSQINAKINEKF